MNERATRVGKMERWQAEPSNPIIGEQKGRRSAEPFPFNRTASGFCLPGRPIDTRSNALAFFLSFPIVLGSDFQ